VLAMIDTGNDTRPSGIVMSHKFVKELGLPMIPVPAARVNTASEGSSMTVVGRVKVVKMFLAGEYVVENVLVLEGLSHSVNIGLKFLQSNYATIKLSPRTLTLELGAAKLDLVSRTQASNRKSMKKASNTRRTSGPRAESDVVREREPVVSEPETATPSIKSVEREPERATPRSVSQPGGTVPSDGVLLESVGTESISNQEYPRLIIDSIDHENNIKIDKNSKYIVDENDICINDENLKELKNNIIVDDHVTSVDVNPVGELLQVSKSQRLKSEKRVRLKSEKKAKVEEENLARLEKCRRREEARLDRCNNSPPDIDFNDVDIVKNSKPPKRVLVNNLTFPSKVQSEYRCKIVGNKKHKRRYFYKINPSFSDLVRVEMILEHSVTPTSAPTLHSTLVPPTCWSLWNSSSRAREVA